MKQERPHVTEWLGQRVDSRKLSLGDFGVVRASIEADAFHNKRSGVSVHITSCKLELFGREVEFLHRITPGAKKRIEQDLLSDINLEIGD